MSGPLASARAAWGEDLPDWIESMALECERTSQSHVAKRLGRSGAMISQILRRIYPSPLDGVEETFRGVFLRATIKCPALGELPTNECRDWRTSAAGEFSTGNPLRVRMYHACDRCPRNQKEPKEPKEAAE